MSTDSAANCLLKYSDVSNFLKEATGVDVTNQKLRDSAWFQQEMES